MWLWFVEKGWLYCMLIMGVVLTVQLIIHWKDWTFLRKMGAFTVIVLVFHVMEEWVMPGGFHYYYNISSDAILRDRYPMNELTDMITNFGGALIWFILVQTVIHVLGASSSRTLLLESGVYSLFYGPGMLTALVCWLPLAVAYTAYFVKTRVKLRDVIGGGVILVVLSILLIIMPESLLKNENTPYVFDNAGWYEQYIDESGAIINRSQE